MAAARSVANSSRLASRKTRYASSAVTALVKTARSQHTNSSSRRRLHSSSPKDASIPLTTPASTTPAQSQATLTVPSAPALSQLPLSQILRTYFMTSISSSPPLMSASTGLLRAMLESNSPIFDLRNPVMRQLLYETFYKQFCAGWDKASIQKTTSEMRNLGYAGVILEYALEVLKDTTTKTDEGKDVEIWRSGMLETVAMAAPGDFLGLKWSGMGPAAMRRMKTNEDPSQEMKEAMHAVCRAARDKNIGLLPAAEETWSLEGFHRWCMDLQREYNVNGKSVIYGTYQAYLKQNPQWLARHLEVAKAEGFTLGVKLVRGAYLGSEKRSLIWPDIETTHHAYDTTASALIHREYNSLLQSTTLSSPFPQDINVVIASHNASTVAKTRLWRQTQASHDLSLTPLVYAQLQGMADEVSCTLLAAAKSGAAGEKGVKERVFKCTTWGEMHMCLNYLLRRAAENRDAASRTKATRDAMGEEIRRRMFAGAGMG
ncbi:proline oxidase like [Lecanosticta acicola]|uniref:Proline dehydrogenase n=1 Tax=Lecanosticta acicola TaxID=111012 RepID=A0AAI8Z2M6_9PEZI|nr:proline oxidase like [Lecanosticta acicola]